MPTTLADINVRIGTEISQFQSGLRKAERELQRSAEKFNQIGNNLAVAVSLPLAGIGIGALKSAGDIEALRLGFEATMTSAGKSTAEATAELLKLQKAAEAPGLDFEQAVKGSVRLQNVGFEAEQSRKILSELANAISLTGGNAEQLDGVTKQFAQMQGKGRILQEDLSILVENMPVLSKVLKDTFGTANAEGLRKLGIGTEEFILKTTEGLAKLERVPGGLNNAFTNAGVSIKLALANVGESINKAFDVTGKLETFSTLITDLAAGFSALDPAVQKTIVGFGLAAVAAGPLFKIIGGGIQVYSTARSALLSFGKAIEVAQSSYTAFQSVSAAGVNSFTSLQNGLRSAATAWKALDVVAKATVIGAALAVVVALGAAFYQMSQEISTAAKVQANLNEVQGTAAKNIAAERLEAERLTGVLKDTNAAHGDQEAALKRLQQISPEYFGQLKLGVSTVDEITAATNRYTESLLKAATVKAAEAKILALEERRLEVLDSIAANEAQIIKNQNRAGSSGFGASRSVVDDRKELASIEEQQRKLTEISLSANKFNLQLQQQATATAGAPITGNALPTGAPLPTGKAPKPDTFDGFKNTKNGLIVIEDQAILTNGILEKLGTKTLPVLTESQNAWGVAGSISASIASEYTEAWAAANLETEKAVQFTTELAAAAQGVIESGLEGALIGVGEAIGVLFSGASVSGSLVGLILDPIIGMVEQLGKIAIATGLAVEGIKKALESLNPIAAIAAGVGLIAIAKLARSQLKNLQPKAFAEGGLVYGPTYSLTGEYPGAKNNPEVIAPLSKLKDMLGGSGGAVQVYGKLQGMDILLSSERSDTRRAQRRGY